MAISQERSRRKSTGGRYRTWKKKKLHELGRLPAYTKLAKKKILNIRVRGNNKKLRILSEDTANVYNPKEKKYEQLKIITIAENPANRHFVRRNIMNKGAIIKTEKGNARITSRPGQCGMINAVLIEKA